MWLYVPGISSPCVQASEASNSAFCSPSAIGERMGAVYVTSRGKLQPQQAWSRRWKQGGFIRLLSGLTCEPSTLNLGMASYISSLRATHARKTASPESAPGQPVPASSPPKSAGSPRSAGLILYSGKTSLGTRTDNSQPSSHHWKGWATALRQEYSVRPKPATPCGASDCSSWPSPMAGAAGTDAYNAAGNSDFSRKAMELADEMISRWPSPKASDPEKAGPNMRGSKGDVPLPGQAAQWEAPSVAVTDGSRLTRGGDRSNELLLTGQAMDASKRWAAPAAQNHKGSSEGSITRSDGKSREDILSYQAEQFFRPPSSPDQPIAGGSMSSTDSPNSNQPSVKRKLNPIFVEALIRWPTGLSGFERPETASIPSPPLTPSSASARSFETWFMIQSQFLQAMLDGPRRDAEQMDLFGATV